jgi:ABC-type polysaccharide/polyol phosphate export permease
MMSFFMNFHSIRPFVSRFLSLHFAGSRLKLGWVFLTPLALSLAIAFIFRQVFRLPEPGLTFSILIGYLSWQFFSGTLSQGHRLLLDQRHFYKQLPENRLFFIAGFVSFRFILALPGFFLVSLYSWLSVSCSPGRILVFFLALLFLYLVTMGLTYLFSAWTVFNPDLTHGLETGLLFFLWLSPVFYSLRDLPIEFQWMGLINPLAWLLDLMHYALNLRFFISPLFALAALIPVSVLIFLGGIFFYQKHHSEMVKRL